jgi:hypothetical protein|tara:strand:+ start:173 stop:685 length:513 start_codon:yes stop_codon:yes gene_type:complete
MSKNIKIIYNFFNFPNLIYENCKKLNFYTFQEMNKIIPINGDWPGKRTLPFETENYFLHLHILSYLKLNGIDVDKYNEIYTHAHIRLAEDEEKDWIHRDDGDTALIYLSNTNLDSGTQFFADDKEHKIAKANFVQNTCVYFEKGLYHTSFGNHGHTIEDARMTLNIFMFK